MEKKVSKTYQGQWRRKQNKTKQKGGKGMQRDMTMQMMNEMAHGLHLGLRSLLLSPQKNSGYE